MSAARKDGQNKHLKPICAEHIQLNENELDMSVATNTLYKSYKMRLNTFYDFPFILFKKK